MGERQGDGGAGGRRRVHPAGTVPGPERAPDGAALQAMLATALRGGALDAEAEQRAVTAFRAARTTAGARGARTRSGDDWRPRGHGRARLPVKAFLGVFAASLTLGGVAVAAIGTAGSPDRGPGDGRPHRSSGAPAEPSPDGSAAAPRTGVSTAPATPDHPAASVPGAGGRCRAYEQVRGRGQALDAPAWRWLVAAAGGEENVARYCAELTGATPAAKGSKGAGGIGRPAAPSGPAAASPAAPGGAAPSGNAASGGGAGGTKGDTGRGNGAGAGTGQDANGGSAGTGQDANDKDKAGAQY